jgi:hypothetical protein
MMPSGLQVDPLGDVGHERQREHPLRRLHVAEADLDRKLGAVPAASGQDKVPAHPAHPRLGEVRPAMPGVGGLRARREQQLQRLADQLAARVTEHQLGPRVDEHDRPRAIDHDDALGRRLEERARGGLAPVQRLLVGLVLDGRRQGPLRGRALQLGHARAEALDFGFELRLALRRHPFPRRRILSPAIGGINGDGGADAQDETRRRVRQRITR